MTRRGGFEIGSRVPRVPQVSGVPRGINPKIKARGTRATRDTFLNMRYTGIQPQYFPRLHYFARILNTDIFVVRDDAQFVAKHKYPDGKNGPSYQAHTPIKRAEGLCLLRLPVKHNGRLPIRQQEISYDEKWVHAHFKTVQTVYGKAPNVELLLPEIKELLTSQYQYVADLNLATILWGLLHLLGEEKVTMDMLSLEYVNKKLQKQNTFRLKKILLGSETKALNDPGLDRNEKIVALIKELGATEDYCGGTAVAAYVNSEQFRKNGITITVQEWTCQEYSQQFMVQQNFSPNLSVIDLLMNVPHEKAVQVIKGTVVEHPSTVNPGVSEKISFGLVSFFNPEMMFAISESLMFV